MHVVMMASRVSTRIFRSFPASFPSTMANAFCGSSSTLRWSSSSGPGGEWGSGAGKGGGTGGTIRDAGGSFGKKEVAQEEEYFRRLQREQLSKLKDHLDEEIRFHEEHIKHHVEVIERHKKKIADLHPKDDVK